MKRELYRLELSGNGVIVYRNDNNIGRIGVVYEGGVYNEYGGHIPKYIAKEAIELLDITYRVRNS
jgi:hypothetical protein